MRTLIVICLLVLFPIQAQAEGAEPPPEPTVTFNAVNKISGRSVPLTIPTGAFSSYDKLQIFPARCIKTIDQDEVSYAALLEIYETSLSKTPTKLFSGWLFSNSHSITNLENQYYDLVLESCASPEEQTPPVDIDVGVDAEAGATQTVPPTEAPLPEQSNENEEPDSIPLD